MTDFTDLILITRDKEARAPHTVIAEGMMVTQDAALKLIKKYSHELSRFGKLRFHFVRVIGSCTGQKQKVWLLNRDQAMFLITLMKNNKKTIHFKIHIIKLFQKGSVVKELLKNSLEYQLMSETLREVRSLHGKETKEHHYSNESRLVNWALTDRFTSLDLESLSAGELDLLLDLQKRNSVLIGAGMPYQDRKEALRIFCELRKAEEA